MYEDDHFLLPLKEKLKFVKQKEDDELQRMQMILDIADETVQDVVKRGAARAAHFEELAKASQTSRNVGISDNKVHLSDGGNSSGNILFSNHLSDPLPIAKTDFDESLRTAVVALRGIARDSTSTSISTVQQKVAPLRSALSVALKERDPGSLRTLSQHSNPKTQQRLKNLKGAAVLYDNLGKLQREQLEPIEKKLMESEFVLPFHHPFVIVANHIRNELLAHETGEDIEQKFNEVFRGLDQELQAKRRQLDPETYPEDSHYHPSAKECFVTLETEREERAELHDQCILMLEDARLIERQGRDFLAPTTKKIRSDALEALDDVTNKAENVRKLAKQAREQLQTSQATREAECQSKIDAATTRTAQLEERAKINRNKQEKAIRRMREEIKSLVKLQTEHRSIVEEIGEQHSQRVSSEVTLEGVRLACASRTKRLIHAESACDHSAGISILVRKQLETAVAECQAHISRVTAQEFTRCSRIADRTIWNCYNWYRALGDLLAIRTQRMNRIQKRSETGGWQVQFLQKHEVDSQDTAIEELETIRRNIEEMYVPLSRSVLALDVNCPSLKFVDKSDPETMRMREVFLQAQDAGRDRVLREGAREAAESLSVRRNRRESSQMLQSERDFSNKHIFHEQDEEIQNRHENSPMSKLLIGKKSRSTLSQNGSDNKESSWTSHHHSGELPSVRASPRHQGNSNNNTTNNNNNTNRNQISVESILKSGTFDGGSATSGGSSSSVLESSMDNAFTIRLPSIIKQREVSVSAIPRPPQQSGAPEPPPRRRA